jgi:hypothetical protein
MVATVWLLILKVIYGWMDMTHVCIDNMYHVDRRYLAYDFTSLTDPNNQKDDVLGQKGSGVSGEKSG